MERKTARRVHCSNFGLLVFNSHDHEIKPLNMPAKDSTSVIKEYRDSRYNLTKRQNMRFCRGDTTKSTLLTYHWYQKFIYIYSPIDRKAVGGGSLLLANKTYPSWIQVASQYATLYRPTLLMAAEAQVGGGLEWPGARSKQSKFDFLLHFWPFRMEI